MPDLILLDVMMPGMDGFETCRKIKGNPTAAVIPILFMTALDSVADKVAGFEAGGVDCITKPFQQVEVLARVMPIWPSANSSRSFCNRKNSCKRCP
jgi:DNA-binding response OmpR family regulator